MNLKHYYTSMPRPVACLLAALFLTTTAMAQKSAPEAYTPLPVTGQKATVIGSRLRSQSLFLGSTGTLVVNDTATFYYYNPAGTAWDSAVYYKYSSGAWSPEARAFNTYTAAGKLLTYEQQGWRTSTSMYGPSRKTTYTYDAAGNMTDSVLQVWNTAAAAYINSARRIVSYNGANARTELIIQTWNTTTSAWVNKVRTVYNLNAQNSILDIVDQTWNTTTSAWVNSYKTSYTYDASGLLALTELDQSWVAATSTWQNNYRDVFTNDAAGHRLTDTYEQYNKTTMVWDKSARVTYAYDAAGNRTSIRAESYNTSSSAYVNSTLDTTTFNSYNQPLVQIAGLGWVSNNWAVTTSTYMYRSTYEAYNNPAGVGNVAGARIGVWPVPASGQLQISLGWEAPKSFMATLTDMSGRLCRSISVQNSAKIYRGAIDIAGLPDGMYMLTVRDADGGVASQAVSVARY